MNRHTPCLHGWEAAFNWIRPYGADDPDIARKLPQAMMIGLAGMIVQHPVPALETQKEIVARAARRAVENPDQLAAIARIAGQALAATRISTGHRFAPAPA